jgi:hypothetical protein
VIHLKGKVPWQDDHNDGMVFDFCEIGMSPCFCMQESCSVKKDFHQMFTNLESW